MSPQSLFVRCIFVTWISSLQTLAFAAEPAKKALVIGNSEYLSKPLANPINDARLMADTLKQIGFDVTMAKDVSDKKAFFELVRSFYDRLPQGSIALVYYAGHGVQINRLNYLLPTGVEFKSERDVEQKAYPLESLQEHLEQKKGGAAINILVFDACRNNPFQFRSGKRGLGDEGFAEMIAPKQSLIAFSTAPGEPAEDGQGEQNSFYTKTLSDEIKKPGVSIEAVLKTVARMVRAKTHDDQRPWLDSSLITEVTLRPLDGKSSIGQNITYEQTKQPKITGQLQIEIGSSGDEQGWYLSMSEAEWAQLDLDIQKRVQYLTEDEVPRLKKRSATGNVVAMTTLALAYRDGVSKMTEAGGNRVFRNHANNTLALKYLRQAATAGFPIAQAELGEMLFTGKGVDKNSREAMQWLERAARVNYPRAKIDLMQVKLTVDPNSAQDMGQDISQLMTSLMPRAQQNPSSDPIHSNQPTCNMATLTGKWQGYYVQGTTKTMYTLDIQSNGNSISGHSVEVDTRTGKRGTVEANWSGYLDKNTVKLTKTYVTSDVALPVTYLGSCFDSGRRIVGDWVISMNGRGTFNMTKLN